jgi:SAM-dependent methyltransferase
MELERVRSWFKPASKVLEIGGGNGYQAGVISSWGCAVVAVDVACPRGETFRKSVLYDGVKLPVREHSIDVVFSSNVLEHVEVAMLAPLLGEIKRALKPGGRVVCIVPTAMWRLWASLSHYPFCLQYLFGRRAVLGGHSPKLNTVLRKRGLLATLSRTVIPGPHGAYRNALSELLAFRRARWHRLFVSLGFQVVAESYSGLFYTGAALFPRMGVEVRRKLARLLGSACSVFILELQQPAS